MNAAPPGDRRNGASVLEQVAPPAGSTSASHVSLGMALAFGGFLSLLMTSTPQVMSVVVLTRNLDRFRKPIDQPGDGILSMNRPREVR